MTIAATNSVGNCRFRWNIPEPSYELRIFQNNTNAIFQIYNTATRSVVKQKNYTFDCSALRRCIQKFAKPLHEVRIFESNEPQALVVLKIDIAAKNISKWMFKNCSQENKDKCINAKNPFVDHETRLRFDPTEPQDARLRWQIFGEKSEVGIVRLSENGTEEELINFRPGEGTHEFEDVKIIRKKQEDREDFICQLFNRNTQSTTEVDLREVPFRNLSMRLQNIQHPDLSFSLTYGVNNLPERAEFIRVEKIQFASGKDLRTITIPEIHQTLLEYLTHKDESRS